MLNKLRKIFNCYKKKYKLKTKFVFNVAEESGFNFSSNSIHYNLYQHPILNASKLSEKVVACLETEKEFKVTKKQALIWILLHEIKHTIDYTYFNKKWNREINRINFNLYFNIDYHNKLPLEKRANKFAKKELKKWINT